MQNLLTNYWWIVVVLLALVMYKLILRFIFGMVIVPDDKIGLVIKNFVLFGSNKEMKNNRIIATNGEAGMQAQTLLPGYIGRSGRGSIR